MWVAVIVNFEFQGHFKVIKVTTIKQKTFTGLSRIVIIGTTIF